MLQTLITCTKHTRSIIQNSKPSLPILSCQSSMACHPCRENGSRTSFITIHDFPPSDWSCVTIEPMIKLLLAAFSLIYNIIPDFHLLSHMPLIKNCPQNPRACGTNCCSHNVVPLYVIIV